MNSIKIINPHTNKTTHTHSLHNSPHTQTKPPTRTAYTTAINNAGQAQQLRRALELVGEMRTRGIPCNVHTYSALMNVCIKVGRTAAPCVVEKCRQRNSEIQQQQQQWRSNGT